MSITARLFCFGLLWGPTLLVLALLVPPSPQTAALHLTTTTALAFIAGRILRLLLQVPLAPPAAGRHRIVPRYPGAAVVLGAMGTALVLIGCFLAMEGGVLHALAGWITGGASLVSAASYRRMGLWEGWLALDGDALVVRTPYAGYSIALEGARLYRRKLDGSVLVTTPDRELEALILPRKARGRYWVDGADKLIERLADRWPVVEVESLLSLKPTEGH